MMTLVSLKIILMMRVIAYLTGFIPKNLSLCGKESYKLPEKLFCRRHDDNDMPHTLDMSHTLSYGP